jgi:hypothetical protein
MQVTSKVNIAEKFDEKELSEIARKVIDDYTSDKDSRGDWERKHSEWIKLYNQSDLPSHRPFPESSEDCLPMLTEACNQFQARSYRTFFPSKKFVDATPTGEVTEDLLERAEKISEHMSYQLGVVNRQYKKDKAQMFLSVALHGSDFTKTYYDYRNKKVVVERVSYENLVVPYMVGQVHMDQVPRKTHEKYMTLNDCLIKEDYGFWLNKAEPISSGDIDSPKQEEQDDFQGITVGVYKSHSDLDGICLILEQHCLLDLDDDGIAEPYIVWVDKTSGKVLRIEVRYYTDEQGNPVDDLGQPSEDKRAIEYFTHYQFLPNPDGFYGLGLGHLVGGTNKSANKMLRQIIDAATLANVGNMSGFVSERLATKGGELKLSLGKFKKMPASVSDI